MPDALSCRLCRHWSALADPASGECRIHAPTLIAAQYEGMGGEPARRIFPVTAAADWCGQWSADPARITADAEQAEAKARGVIKRLERKLEQTSRSLEIARGNPAPAQTPDDAGQGETVRGDGDRPAPDDLRIEQINPDS